MKPTLPKFIQNILPLALIAGLVVGSWTWLMYRKNK